MNETTGGYNPKESDTMSKEIKGAEGRAASDTEQPADIAGASAEELSLRQEEPDDIDKAFEKYFGKTEKGKKKEQKPGKKKLKTALEIAMEDKEKKEVSTPHGRELSEVKDLISLLGTDSADRKSWQGSLSWLKQVDSGKAGRPENLDHILDMLSDYIDALSSEGEKAKGEVGRIEELRDSLVRWQGQLEMAVPAKPERKKKEITSRKEEPLTVTFSEPKVEPEKDTQGRRIVEAFKEAARAREASSAAPVSEKQKEAPPKVSEEAELIEPEAPKDVTPESTAARSTIERALAANKGERVSPLEVEAGEDRIVDVEVIERLREIEQELDQARADVATLTVDRNRLFRRSREEHLDAALRRYRAAFDAYRGIVLSERVPDELEGSARAQRVGNESADLLANEFREMDTLYLEAYGRGRLGNIKRFLASHPGVRAGIGFGLSLGAVAGGWGVAGPLLLLRWTALMATSAVGAEAVLDRLSRTFSRRVGLASAVRPDAVRNMSDSDLWRKAYKGHLAPGYARGRRVGGRDRRQVEMLQDELISRTRIKIAKEVAEKGEEKGGKKFWGEHLLLALDRSTKEVRIGAERRRREKGWRGLGWFFANIPGAIGGNFLAKLDRKD